MPPPDNDPWAPLFIRLLKFKERWPAPGWKWDGRLVALESAFGQPMAAAARASADELLPQAWTGDTLAKAPAHVQQLSARTGAMRPGQSFLAADAVNGVVPYGLWWPWGGGATITLRVGLAGVEPTAEPWPRLRELFSVGG